MTRRDWAFTLLLAASAAGADEPACPAYHGAAPLAQVSVFDGPPEEQADLVPDRSEGTAGSLHSEWDLGYLYDQGRNAVLVCRYGKSADPVTVPITRKVARCVFRAHGGKPAEMSCR